MILMEADMKYFIINLLLTCAFTATAICAASTHEGLSPRDDEFSPRRTSRARAEVTIYKVVYNRGSNFSPHAESPAALLHSLADEISREAEENLPLERVKVSNLTNMVDLSREIRRSLLSDKRCEVDCSFSDLHDEWIEMFTEMILSQDMRRYVQNMERLNLQANFIGVLGLQALIPLLRLNTLKVVDVSNTAIDEEQLEAFGSSEAYDQYTSEKDRIILSVKEREALLKKLIWISKSFFDPIDKNKNPSGVFVTPEVIHRHREYFGLAY